MIGKVKLVMLRGEKGDPGASGNYDELSNRPQINGVTLTGNKTAADLGLAAGAEQASLISTVSGLGDTVQANSDAISTLQTDVAALETIAQGNAIVVTADYDNSTKSLTNPSATAAQIYAAMHTHDNPCFLIGTDTNGREYVFVCVYSTATAAYFTRINTTRTELGKVDVYGLSDDLGGFVYYGNDSVNTPYIVTATINESTRELSAISATYQDISEAVNTYHRPCFLFASSNAYNCTVAQCVSVGMIDDTYKAIFQKRTDGIDEQWDIMDIGGATSSVYNRGFVQATFVAGSGVTATEKLIQMGRNLVLNFSASGTFSSGSKTMGQYTGVSFDSNPQTVPCAIRTGNNGANFDAVGTATLAANGTLTVYYNGSYTGVSINMANVLT